MPRKTRASNTGKNKSPDKKADASLEPDQAVNAETKIAIGTTKKMRSNTDMRSRLSSWTVIVVSIWLLMITE
jgi:hypothetical protein